MYRLVRLAPLSPLINQTVTEANESDNTVTVTDTVAPPNPGFYITADRIQVRSGDSVNLEWGAIKLPNELYC